MAATSFQFQNQFALRYASAAGLYTPSVDKIIKNKFILACVKILPYIYIGFVGFHVFSDFYLTVTVPSDIKVKMGNFRRIAIFVSMLSKPLYMILKKNKLEDLFETWNNSFQASLNEEDRQERFLTGRKTIKKLIITGTLISELTIIIVTLPSLIRLKIPVYERIVIHIEDGSLASGFYLVYLLVRGQIVVLSGGFDGLALTLMSYVAIQLEHLKCSLAAIVDMLPLATEDNRECLDPDNITKQATDAELIKQQRLLEERLHQWIAHHQEVIRFTNQLNEFLQPVLTLELTLAALYLVLVCVQIAEGVNSMAFIIGVAIYLVGTYFIIMAVASRGDQITDQNATIFEEAFSKSWFLHSPQVKSCLKMIILRSQSELAITTWKIYPFGMRRVAKLLQMSYNIFTFMVQVLKKNKL